MKLTGTKTTPSRAVANDKTTNCQQLCDSSASRPPFFRPLAARAAAVSDTAASSSANVSRVSPPTMASLPGTHDLADPVDQAIVATRKAVFPEHGLMPEL